MPIVVNSTPPLSSADTIVHSSSLSTWEPDSKMRTHQTSALGVRAHDASTAINVSNKENHFRNDQDNMVQFSGLYVVRGPTESKHVRYTMDVTVDDVQLHTRCIQRFQSFYLLRKRLLAILKTCHDQWPSQKSAGVGLHDEPPLSAGAELVSLLTRTRGTQCTVCKSTYHQLAAVKFPHRTLFPPRLQDIQDRSQMLETFLDYCVRFATTWSACQRSKRMFVATLGTFLGVDLRTHLANQKEVGVISEARTVVCVNKLQDNLSDAFEPQSPSEVACPPFSHEMSNANDSEDDRHTEPNYSFISNLANDTSMKKRSQSHR